jgi:hypothetical protein
MSDNHEETRGLILASVRHCGDVQIPLRWADLTTLSLPQGNKGNMHVYRNNDSQDNLSLETCSAISLRRIARKYIRHHDCNVNCDSTRILRSSFKSICTDQFYRTRPLKFELVQRILRRSWCRKRNTNMMFTLHFRFKSIQL